MLKGIIPVTISANLIKNLGSDQPLFVSGRLLAMMTLGKDNEGLITRREYLQYFNTLSIETKAALIADGQSGFGNELSAWTTAKELGNAGAQYLVLNDQKWPAKSVEVTGTTSDKIFINMVKAAVAGGKDYDLQIIPKLEGIKKYGYSKLVNRIELLLKMGIKQIIVARLNRKELAQLKEEKFFSKIGIELDNSDLGIKEVKSIKPKFILPVESAIATTLNAEQQLYEFYSRENNHEE
ncbi:isocitrate lyase/phosphoenolpyruvate mutase family protein [Lactobacillus sp. wkB10]|uniref:isocitrate lyase/phosphoenolpyruvate mutase family protein n=1 Tax=Lactobacillus sp. wkB10 TaxID=1545701 RepID=UPI0005134840|nr:isocitrate lyase/phosphoenolpyruvate mutase family protein [Lactobacillus sp. wkB10]KGG54497.1 Carboxyvinyl-carboxyphosphonate phosphorylmutase [Lactobacillus sp. wkB10]